MGRNNKDFDHGVSGYAVRHPNNPNDVLMNRSFDERDPKIWVPQALAEEAAEKAKRDETTIEDV